jgi:hypothetical protein
MNARDSYGEREAPLLHGIKNHATSFEAVQVRTAQANTELREPSHHREDQVSGGDTILGTHRLVA